MVNYEHNKKYIYVKDIPEPRIVKNIMILDNAVDKEWCDYLIEKYESTAKSHYKANVPSIDGTDIEVVNLTKLYVAMEDTWEKEKQDMSNLMLDAYFTYKTLLKYPILRIGLPEAEHTIIELPTIKKYIKGSDEHIGPHSDSYMRGWEETNTVKIYKGDRFLNILFYLNDVEEGGETEFYFDDCTITVPPRKGRIVVFPPLWTHVHAGLRPISSDKYICNGHLRAAVTEQSFIATRKGY